MLMYTQQTEQNIYAHHQLAKKVILFETECYFKMSPYSNLLGVFILISIFGLFFVGVYKSPKHNSD